LTRATAAAGVFASALLALGLLSPALAQPRSESTAAPPGVVRGIYNWVHTTGDAERAFPFYRDVLGIELARSPFAAPAAADAPAERIRSKESAGSDPLVWKLTNTQGARFRTVFSHASNTPFGLELSEFFDIPRALRAPNPWDPGAAKLIFRVRDLAAVAAKLGSAPVVTVGGAPLPVPAGRSLLVRDPDGSLVQLTQASAAEIRAKPTGEIIETSLGITTADTKAALGFYSRLLGFRAGETRRGTTAELRLNGLTQGELVETTTTIPGTAVSVVLASFRVAPNTVAPPNPYQWRIQDVGAPQLQLQVAGLDALINDTKRSGYRFLSVDAEAIERPFGRFIFAIDPDGVLVEFVEPTDRIVR
jgi:catechol 2,3-dioxygenase-like lactoylglutathione lyase family enzyme